MLKLLFFWKSKNLKTNALSWNETHKALQMKLTTHIGNSTRRQNWINTNELSRCVPENSRKFNEKVNFEEEKMAQWFRDVLPSQGLGLNPNNHMAAHNYLIGSPRGTNVFYLPPDINMVHGHTCTKNTNTHKIKKQTPIKVNLEL